MKRVTLRKLLKKTEVALVSLSHVWDYHYFLEWPFYRTVQTSYEK